MSLADKARASKYQMRAMRMERRIAGVVILLSKMPIPESQKNILRKKLQEIV